MTQLSFLFPLGLPSDDSSVLKRAGDDEERINAIMERSAILDTSKFVRIAVDWLLRSDIGEVIKEIVHDEEHFPDYQIPKKPTGGKSAGDEPAAVT